MPCLSCMPTTTTPKRTSITCPSQTYLHYIRLIHPCKLSNISSRQESFLLRSNSFLPSHNHHHILYNHTYSSFPHSTNHCQTTTQYLSQMFILQYMYILDFQCVTFSRVKNKNELKIILKKKKKRCIHHNLDEDPSPLANYILDQGPRCTLV